MKDCPTRRNRVAAITANYWNAALSSAVDRATPGNEPVVEARAVLNVLGYVLAALAGTTDPAELGIPANSTSAVQIHLLTQETPKP